MTWRTLARTVVAAALLCPVIVLGPGTPAALAFTAPPIPVTIPGEAGTAAGDATFLGEAAGVGTAGIVGLVAFGEYKALKWEYNYFQGNQASPDDLYSGYNGATPECPPNAGNGPLPVDACWQTDVQFQGGAYGANVPWNFYAKGPAQDQYWQGHGLRVDIDCRSNVTGQNYWADTFHIGVDQYIPSFGYYPDGWPGDGSRTVQKYLNNLPTNPAHYGGDLCDAQQPAGGGSVSDHISRMVFNDYPAGTGVWTDGGPVGNPARTVTATGRCSSPTAGSGAATPGVSADFTPAPGAGAKPDMVMPTCPSGSLLTAVDASDSQGHHLLSWTAPPTWSQPGSPYYACELGSNGVPCQVLLKNAAGDVCAASGGSADCTSFDPSADPSTSPYHCFWGTYAVALSDCTYARPQPQTDPQPSTSPSPSDSPSTGSDPSASPSPGSSASPSPGPGGSGSPSPSTSPSPGTIAGGQPVDTTGPDGTDQVASCYPHGFGLLNPVEWILKPVECALKWAFVPSSAQMSSVDDLSRDMAGRAPFGTVTAMNAFVGHLTGADVSCSGVFSLDVPLGSYIGTVHVLSTADSGGVAAQLQRFRPLLSVCLYAMVCVPLVWWAWRAYAPASTDTG